MKYYNNLITRRDVVSKAADECMKELYSYCQPSVEWEDFMQQCENYTKKYNEWTMLERGVRPKIEEYCGPKPYEFYYLPKDVMNEICASYVSSYKLDGHSELVDTIDILKNYCNDPIVDKYIEERVDEYGNRHPGYRSYDHPSNLQKEVESILDKNGQGANSKDVSKQVCEKFFSFLDMAENFFNWNRELNGFNMTVYLGVSPNSNKEAVIENWKKYRNQDIVIDDNMYADDSDEDEYYDN